jgi:GNAT superfamily N-acetyltransferase
LMQDREADRSMKPLATLGRTIHSGHSSDPLSCDRRTRISSAPDAPAATAPPLTLPSPPAPHPHRLHVLPATQERHDPARAALQPPIAPWKGAVQDIRRRVAGCFVALNDARVIMGFYALAATSVAVDKLPSDLTKRLPRYPLVPAVLMGRLTVAVEYQGQELGSALIFDAAIRTDRLGIGAFALIVDAKDDRAVAFYRANGFALIPGEARRLFVPVATALGGDGGVGKFG